MPGTLWFHSKRRVPLSSRGYSSLSRLKMRYPDSGSQFTENRIDKNKEGYDARPAKKIHVYLCDDINWFVDVLRCSGC